MEVKVSYDKNQPYNLVREYAQDAGIDIPAPRGFSISPGETAIVETGIHIQLPEGTAGLIVGRSSLNMRGVVVQGLIDEGYAGQIDVMMTNADRFADYYVAAGDRIAQLVIIPVVKPEITEVDKIDGGPRGARGFGSTGR